MTKAQRGSTLNGELLERAQTHQQAREEGGQPKRESERRSAHQIRPSAACSQPNWRGRSQCTSWCRVASWSCFGLHPLRCSQCSQRSLTPPSLEAVSWSCAPLPTLARTNVASPVGACLFGVTRRGGGRKVFTLGCDAGGSHSRRQCVRRAQLTPNLGGGFMRASSSATTRGCMATCGVVCGAMRRVWGGGVARWVRCSLVVTQRVSGGRWASWSLRCVARCTRSVAQSPHWRLHAHIGEMKREEEKREEKKEERNR